LSTVFAPVNAADLAARLVEEICRVGVGHPIRTAVDGPPATSPHELARAMVEPLRVLGRDPVLVAAETFWRDASLRLEYGHEDVDAYLTWLDAAALRREVLDPLGPGGSGRHLLSLRDPVTNRATREPALLASAATVLIVSGSLLLGLGLPFDVTIHLASSPAARARRTPPQWAWTLAAFDRYDAEVAPSRVADVVVRVDDPRHPAIAVVRSS
jgi:hypothetical protein